MKNLLLVLLTVISVKSYSQAFTNQFTPFLHFVSIGDVKWGDYDNDGDLDLIVCGSDNSSILICKIYRNDGSNAFVDINASLTGLENCEIEWFDYNNDGKLDIIIVGSNQTGTNVVNIYRNDSNGVFTSISHGITGLTYPSIDFGDYDSDGKVDLLITGSDGQTWNSILGYYVPYTLTRVYKNYGNGVFTNINISLVGVRSGDAKFCDYDNDGDLDFLVTGFNTPTLQPTFTQLYRNDNGNFTPITTSIVGTQNSAIEWGDFDNDGDFDVIISGGVSKIYRNDGNDIFTDMNVNLQSMSFSNIDLGDYNNDGLLDIILSGSAGATYYSNIYRNNGNFSFTDINASIGSNGDLSASVEWGDYDNDGDLDLLVCGHDAGGRTTMIIRNNSSVTNTKPTKSTFRNTIVNGNSATMFWNKCSDNQTPSNALTYNVYVGKGNYDESVMSCMSTIKPTAIGIVPYGRRDIPKLGNALVDTFYTIHDLDTGTYYWGVQTIDNGYLGSDFSSPQTFTILPSTVSINETITDFGIKVYPNPANDFITFEFNDTQEHISLDIIDFSGRLVKNVKISNRDKIDVTSLNKGIYFIIANINGIKSTSKFIKL